MMVMVTSPHSLTKSKRDPSLASFKKVRAMLAARKNPKKTKKSRKIPTRTCLLSKRSLKMRV